MRHGRNEKRLDQEFSLRAAALAGTPKRLRYTLGLMPKRRSNVRRNTSSL